MIRKTHQFGFTLIELVIVLAIAAIVMAVVPTLFSAVFPGVELKSSARRTAATLHLARELAIRDGVETTLIVDLSTHHLELTGYQTLELPSSLTLQLDAAQREMINNQRGAIRFFPDGSSTGGRIFLTLKRRGYQIGVTWLTGKIELTPWQVK